MVLVVWDLSIHPIPSIQHKALSVLNSLGIGWFFKKNQSLLIDLHPPFPLAKNNTISSDTFSLKDFYSHQIMKRPKVTHCGLSLSKEAVSSSSSSGCTGASFSTVVKRFTWQMGSYHKCIIFCLRRPSLVAPELLDFQNTGLHYFVHFSCFLLLASWDAIEPTWVSRSVSQWL